MEKQIRRDSAITASNTYLEPFFVIAMSQSPGLPEALATAYNPGMCLLTLPAIYNIGKVYTFLYCEKPPEEERIK